jgi:F-type H+-transporting ATPase subunit delta
LAAQVLGGDGSCIPKHIRTALKRSHVPLTLRDEISVATDETMTASVAGRYASALFDLAKEQNAVALVEADLGKFDSMLAMSEDLRNLVHSPVVSATEQGKALAAVLAKAGVGGTTANFVALVAKNRRLFVIPQMIANFRTLAAKARGEVTAEVTSAQPLTDAQTAALKESLRATAGNNVILATKVDPSLLGGLVVKIGSRMIDSSLKTKLANLSVALKAGA